jgi:hypothetical protein
MDTDFVRVAIKENSINLMMAGGDVQAANIRFMTFLDDGLTTVGSHAFSGYPSLSSLN